MTELKSVVPYKNDSLDKKSQVAKMFDNISGKYDFLNHFLSLGIDIYWRKRAIKLLKKQQPAMILDVATGTGDLAIAALKANPAKVVGVDISNGMLDVGKKKLKKKNLESRIELLYGDSEHLPFEDNSFDAVMVAFGVRNFENLSKGLTDMIRVLKPGGQVYILEFSTPTIFPFKQIYDLYFRYILPVLGKRISKDSSAYTYLPESVKAFPDGEKFTTLLNSIGYKTPVCTPLTLGICSLYTAEK